MISEASRIADYWYTTMQECKSTDFDLIDREPTTTVSTTTTKSTTTTISSTTTTKEDLSTCGSNVHASIYQICGALKWHCNTQDRISKKN